MSLRASVRLLGALVMSAAAACAQAGAGNGRGDGGAGDVGAVIDLRSPPRDAAAADFSRGDFSTTEMLAVDLAAPLGSDLAEGPRDLATPSLDFALSPPDLALSPPDLALPPPDLALPPADLATPPDPCKCVKKCLLGCQFGCCVEDIVAQKCTPKPECLLPG